MKVTFAVSLWKEHAPKGTFERLLKVEPTGCNQVDTIFECQYLLGDGRVTEIQKILAQQGIRAWSGFANRQYGECRMVYGREYHSNDFASSVLLQPLGRQKTDFNFARRLPDGRLEIEPRFFKRRIFFELNFTPSFIVSRAVRKWLEAACLSGMCFRPTAKEKGRGAADEDNLWELTSERVMPAMSPYCSWFDEQGNPAVGEPERGRIFKEELFSPPEYHYSSKALERVKDSDIRITWERFWLSGASQHPGLVVSKRFYDVCHNHKLEMNWVPVRLDP